MIYKAGKVLSHLHSSTNDLSQEILETVCEFIYCSRNGIDSVCLVTRDLDTLLLLVSNLPNEINEAETQRYAVDLSTIGTDSVKLYIDSPNEKEAVIGFHCKNNGDVIQRKIYKRGDQQVLLDRYEDGNLISENEQEVVCESSGWGGSSELLNNILSLSEEHDLSLTFLKRTSSNQSYIRVR